LKRAFAQIRVVENLLILDVEMFLDMDNSVEKTFEFLLPQKELGCVW
jgi:hypothetical protein